MKKVKILSHIDLSPKQKSVFNTAVIIWTLMILLIITSIILTL